MTAIETILRAAAGLHESGMADFSEWDLTVAAYRLAPEKLGMRGHPQYPDHKRVAMDLMAYTRRQTRMGYDVRANGRSMFVKVRPNYYRLTEVGWQRLWPRAALALLTSRACQSWINDPAQPEEADPWREALLAARLTPPAAKATAVCLPACVPECAQPRALLYDFVIAMIDRFDRPKG